MNKYIYVIDGNSDAVDWLDSLFTIGDILVTSVQDMVDRVLNTLGDNNMRSLFIGGHGSPGYQAVGAGPRGDSTGTLSLQLGSDGKLKGNSEHHLMRLRSNFSHDAIVTLGGCRTGEGSAGDALLLELSRVLSVPVEAGTANQRPFVPGMEGSVRRCSGDSCQTLSSNWWGSPGGGGIN
ncbi:MAG TPA: hypothetical protein VMM38_09040 [Aridibacter sp.]|nr:hypothetical protein [Aridibacter sp.]